MVVAISDSHGGIEISLLKGDDLSEVGNFHLRPCTIMRLQVRDNGRVLITVRYSAKDTVLIVREINGHSESITVPSTAEIFHVWDNFICLRDKKEMIVRRFDGGECCRADTTPLEQIGGSFAFFFNHKDDLAMVSLNRNNFHFIPIEPLHLDTTSHRWQKLLHYKQEYETAQVSEQQLQASKKAESVEAFANQRGRLTSSLEELVSQRLSKELSQRVRQGEVTTAQVNSAVNNALQIVKAQNSSKTALPEYLEIKQVKKASAPSKPKLELQFSQQSKQGAVDPIVARIKELCEQLQAGQITQADYTLQLSFLSAKLVHNRTKK